jgi:hypothetical protein
MWPFTEMSLEDASSYSGWANWILVGSLVSGALATFAIVQTADTKELHWERARLLSKDQIKALEENSKVLAAEAKLAERQIAIANENAAASLERAAEANQKAETERLARVKMQASLASRTLTQDQSEKIISTLAGKGIRQINFTRIGDSQNPPPKSG